MTFEDRERLTIRRAKPGYLAWCDRCREEVWMVPPEEAAAISLTDTRAIFRDVEAGTIHFIEHDGDSILICSKSLPFSL